MVIKIRRILFPTDFSAYSFGILGFAGEFALNFKASLVIHHVVEDLPLTQHPTVSIYSVDEILEDAEKRARKKLRKEVVRKSSCPVLTIRPQKHRFRMP